MKATHVRRIRGTADLRQSGDDVEIAVDDTGLKIAHPTLGTALAITDVGTQTISGDKTLTGTTVISGAATLSNVAAASFDGSQEGTRRAALVTTAAELALATSKSGQVTIAARTSSTQVFTLPAAATHGLHYTFVCGHADGEIHVAVQSGDNIIGKVSADADALGLSSTVTTGLLKNTAASNVVGDFVTLVSDGVTTWYMVAVAGVWSVT